MSAIDEYYQALERLKNGTAKKVNTDSLRFTISNNSVAKEAGKKIGSIREARYPKLCDDIKKAEQERLAAIPENTPAVSKLKGQAKHQKELKDKANKRYRELEEKYQEALGLIMNLARENYRLRKQLTEYEAEQLLDRQINDIVGMNVKN